MSLLLAHCAGSNFDSRYGVSPSPRVVDLGEPVPKGGGTYRVGSPYVVSGRTYVPSENPHYAAVGLASWYGEDFHGRYTANGEIYDLNAISAAHPTMPIPSYARVTNLNNGRSLVVRVNDRGPFAANRIIDVSVRAARLLDFYDRGTTRVRVEYLGRAPMQGSNDRILRATLRENQPAPDPNTLTLADTEGPDFPPAPPPAAPTAILASAAAKFPLHDSHPAHAMSYADPTAPAGAEGTAQFLNGRGLY
ncbi:MAG: septal ring lytic transglycosylase RlpA family protein [Xanthobacteraceae bacterium]